MKKLLSLIIALTLLATTGCVVQGESYHHHNRGGNPPPANTFIHSSGPARPAPDEWQQECEDDLVSEGIDEDGPRDNLIATGILVVNTDKALEDITQ